MNKTTLQKEQYRMRKLDLNELNRYLQKIQMRLDELGIGQHLDLLGRKIIHLANAVKEGDAVPLGQLESLIGTSTGNLEVNLGPPGRNGEDGEDAWFIPAKDGLTGIPGRMGIPGRDGEDAEENDLSLRMGAHSSFGADEHPQYQQKSLLNAAILAYLQTLPKFSAHKNGTNQTGIVSAVLTKVTFPTEDYDIVNNYDTGTSQWVPGIIGKAHINAAIRWVATVDQIMIGINLYKNGAQYKNVVYESSGTGGYSCSISCDVLIDVITDYFEIYAYQASGVDQVIDGTSIRTWFMGHMLP